MRRLARCRIAAACAAALGCGAPAPEPADLILLGGRIVTLEERQPEVEALAARDGRIVALGPAAEVRRHAGSSTRIIDLAGRLAVPGFIEGHGHFTGIGASLQTADLTGLASWDEVVERVAAVASRTPPGAWILGWGWHQDEWRESPSPAVEGYPTHERLSRAVPDHPVLLKHAAGSHAGLINARALELAGIDRDTPDPAGGRILRDAGGEPTGVLLENALALALAAHERALASESREESDRRIRERLELADRECLSKGVTSFQDAGSDLRTLELMRQQAAAGRLGVRLWVMLSDDDEVLRPRLAELTRAGASDERVTVHAIKRTIDGALGSRGAWLLEPYADLPQDTGLNTLPVERLEQSARLALDHGLQLCVHAIGDRANRETLDVYARVLAGVPDGRARRWRIEHAQHLAPEDVPRFAELGVIASMQAVHCTSDATWVPSRVGPERAAAGAYVWRKLLESGAVVINGTDAPIEDVDPIANFHAAVTRRTATGETFHPEQRMTRMEALRASTLGAAWAAFEEGLKGSLALGKLADVTVLSRDILAVPEEEIPSATVDFTIVGGRVLHERHP